MLYYRRIKCLCLFRRLEEMKHILIAAFLLLLFVSTSSAASPPYCPKPTVPDAFKQASAVFVGEVLEVVEPLPSDSKALSLGSFYTLRFKVEKAWKGIDSQEISVLSPLGGYEALPLPVNKGDKYLVYADPPYDTGKFQKGQLIMGNMCNRSMLLSRANDDIKELEAITRSCLENSSQTQDSRSNLKQSQDILRLPWYIITTNDLSSVGESILGKKRSAGGTCLLCGALK